MARSDAVGGCVHWAVAFRPYPGQSRCGDRAVVRLWPGRALIMVIDGLGHGAAAADVASAAADVAATLESTATVETTLAACHARLRSTRGAAMTVAVIDAGTGTLAWAGIGNVDGVLVRRNALAPRGSVRLHGGIVGCTMPHLHVSTSPLAIGDRLVIASDGVGSSFIKDISPGMEAQSLADYLLAQHGRDNDDALVLVAEFIGSQR